MIDLTVSPERLENTIKRARERNIRIPTFRQQRQPDTIPADIAGQLPTVDMDELNPLNLFRITWHNQPTARGGYGPVNYLEFPPALTGVPARVVALVGKWFPTGAHKVGAAFGCLVPQLVTGQFDPTSQKAVWPSTGNYCRGGAYDSALLGCRSIAVLPEGMSKERFAWLQTVADEVIKTPGSESNVKEIFDQCRVLRESGEDLVIFNQFDQMGNYLWHHEVTGPAMHAVLEATLGPRERYRGLVVATGSAGTIAAGDYLKQHFPNSKIAATEALQCPTLLHNGFGAHRIEGIGDKHVPWVHNVKNTDVVIGVDDEATVSLLRLFNEPAGRQLLAAEGVGEGLLEKLPWLGISGIGNLLAAAKFARYYELGPDDVVLTVLTDSVELYASRLDELNAARGALSPSAAVAAYHRYLLGQSIDHVQELGYYDRKRLHNLKYYTWVEQQGKSQDELQAQWYDPAYWHRIPALADEIDRLIVAFNRRTGLG